MLRSQINKAPYDPRTITDENRRKLLHFIKKIGLIGPVVVNDQTSNLVSGHKRTVCMDVLNGYFPEKPETDYLQTISQVSMTPAEEAGQNFHMNNPLAQGDFDIQGVIDMINDEYDNDAFWDTLNFERKDLERIGVDGSFLEKGGKTVEEAFREQVEETVGEELGEGRHCFAVAFRDRREMEDFLRELGCTGLLLEQMKFFDATMFEKLLDDWRAGWS